MQHQAHPSYLAHLQSKHAQCLALSDAAARGEQIDWEPGYVSLPALEEELQATGNDCAELLLRGDDGNLHLVFHHEGAYTHVALDQTHNPQTDAYDRGLVIQYDAFPTFREALHSMTLMVEIDRN